MSKNLHFLAAPLAEVGSDEQVLSVQLDDGNLFIQTATNTVDSDFELVCLANQMSEQTFKQVHQFFAKQAATGYAQYLPGSTEIVIRWPLQAELADAELRQLKDWAADKQIDIWQLTPDRPSLAKPGLLVMDMDSTTIKIECIDEIAKLAGVGEQVAEVTELAMQGKLDFAESLRGRVGTLKNAPVDIIEQVASDLPLMHGLENLIKHLKQAGWKIAIASGGFTYFADRLKDQLGLDAAVANQLEIDGDRLTGQVLGDIVDAQVKADTLQKLAVEYGIEPGQTVAMGDGANDLVMMSAAQLGVAFEAKPLVQERADLAINYHGLDALLAILKSA
ncbi:phosphoserine phosphatase SerB [Gayadomonas joobiniege]|uniref:phosphoserine phosphatase SerB n=1 Tax=Gayadomonas joobiniege TaxID=1234606 RepID=UPI0003780887|nr:phosphoserine phosphatase SerB [Gayadomonas joobiniege]